MPHQLALFAVVLAICVGVNAECTDGTIAIAECGGGCFPPSARPVEDLCGVFSGGCTLLPINDCIECNPDPGDDPLDKAAASTRGYYPCRWNPRNATTITNECLCAVVLPEVPNCNDPISVKNVSYFVPGATSNQRFYTSTGGGTGNEASGAGGFTFGLPNYAGSYGVGTRMDLRTLRYFNVDVSSGYIAVRRFSVGIHRYNYNTTRNIPLKFAIRPTIVDPQLPHPQPDTNDANAYGIATVMLSNITLNTNNYTVFTYVNPLPIAIPSSGATAPNDQVFSATIDMPFDASDVTRPHPQTNSFIVPRVTSSNVNQNTSIPAQVHVPPIAFFHVPLASSAEVNRWTVIDNNGNKRLLDFIFEIATCTAPPSCLPEERGCDGICYSNTSFDECGRCKPLSAHGHFDVCGICVGGDSTAPINSCGVECCGAPANEPLSTCEVPGLLRNGECVVDPCFGLGEFHTAADALPCFRAEPFNARVWREGLRFHIAQMSLATYPLVLSLQNVHNPHVPGGYDVRAALLALYNRTYPSMFDAYVDAQRVFRDMRDSHVALRTTEHANTFYIPMTFRAVDTHGGNPATDQYITMREVSRNYTGCITCAALEAQRRDYDPVFRAHNPALSASASIADFYGWRVVRINGNASVPEYLADLALHLQQDRTGSTSLAEMVTPGLQASARRLRSDDPMFPERARGYNITLRDTAADNAITVDITLPWVSTTRQPRASYAVRPLYVSRFWSARFPNVTTLSALGSLLDDFVGRNITGWLQFADGPVLTPENARRSVPIDDAAAHRYDRPIAPVDDETMGVFARRHSAQYYEFMRSIGISDDMISRHFSPTDWETGDATVERIREAMPHYETEHRRMLDSTFVEIVPGNASVVGYYRSDVHRIVVLRILSFASSTTSTAQAMNEWQRTILSAAQFLTDNPSYRVVIDITENEGGIAYIGAYLLDVLDPRDTRRANYIGGFNASAIISPRPYFDAYVENDFHRWTMKTIDAQFGNFILRDTYPAGLASIWRARNGANPTVSFKPPGEDPFTEFYTYFDARQNGTQTALWGDYYLAGTDPNAQIIEPPPIRREYKRGEIILLTSATSFSAAGYFTSDCQIWGIPTIVFLGGLKSAQEQRPRIAAGVIGNGIIVSVSVLNGASNSQNTQYDLNSLYAASNQYNVSLPEPEKYNVFPFTWSRLVYVGPQLIAGMKNKQIIMPGTAEHPRADCVLYGNVGYKSDAYLNHLQEYIDELSVPEVINACGCADEFRDCQGTCFGKATDCVREDCDPADPRPCQMADACGSCGASVDSHGSGQLVVEGWPPPQGVAVVADTW